MKQIFVTILIACSISISAQELKISDMISLLDKSRELFNKEFWKGVKFYESFGSPMETIDSILLKHKLEFNNFDMEEGYYDEVDLRYLQQKGTPKEFRLTVQSELDNSLSYSFKEIKEWNELKKETEAMGGQFQKITSDTMSVPGMDHISVDHHYNYKNKTIVFTESRFVTSKSAGKPDYYVRIRYRD